MTGKPPTETRVLDADLQGRAISAALWSATGHWLARLITPVVFLVLARVLAPRDFGIAAVATMVIAFCQVVAEAGMGKVIVQRHAEGEDIAPIATNAFWANLGIAATLFVALLAAAPWVAALFAEPLATNVIRLQSVQLLLGAFSSIPMALLQRELDFRRIFTVQLGTTALGGLVSVPLALYGLGYWALVAGSLVSALASALWLWRISSWRPARRLDRAALPGMLRFGGFSMGEGLSGWMFLWLDAILVGIYLSTHELGLYRTAGTFIAVLAGLIVAPVVPVIFRAFSLLQHDRARLVDSYLTATQLMTMVSVATSILLLCAFDYWPALVFGEQWIGIEPVLFVFVMLYAYGGLSYANAELFRAANRPDVPFAMNLAVLAVYFVGFTLSLRAGFEAFLQARYLLAVLSILAHVVVLDRIMGIATPQFLRRTVPSLAVFAVFVLLITLLEGRGPAWPLVAAAASMAALLFINRRECRALSSAIWQSGFGRSPRT